MHLSKFKILLNSGIGGQVLIHLAIPFLIYNVNELSSWLLFTILFYILIAHWGISLGYHKLFSHRSFNPSMWVALSTVIVCISAFIGSPYAYSMIHRLHHKHVDTDKDPHTPKDRWYHAYFFPFFVKEKLEKNFSKEELRKTIDDLFKKYPWFKKLTDINQWLIALSVYLILWFIEFDLVVAWASASILSYHAGAGVNTFCHVTKNGITTIVDMPILSTFVGSPYNHKYHHNNPSDYNESAHGSIDFMAIMIKKFLNKNK